MVSIELSPGRMRWLSGAGHARTPVFAAAALGASVLVVLASLAFKGIDVPGWKLASAMTLRLSFFIFILSYVALPLGHLLPIHALRALSHDRHKLTFAFLVAFAASVFCVGAPYFLHLTQEHMPAMSIMYCIINGGFAALMLTVASPATARFLGQRPWNAVLKLTTGFFWAMFALADIDYLIGPHRPDAYYGFSLLLLVCGILLRFADVFVERHRDFFARLVSAR